MKDQLSFPLRSLLATILLFLMSLSAPAQEPVTPAPPANPELSESKRLTQDQIDRFIARAFGRECEELRWPIRLWLADVGVAIAAKEASVAADGLAVRFTTVHARVPENESLFADTAVVESESPVKHWKELVGRKMKHIEICYNSAAVVVVPTEATSAFLFTSAGNGIAPPPVASAPPPAGAPAPLPAAPPSSEETQSAAPRPIKIRYRFKIDPEIKLADLLPVKVKKPSQLSLSSNEDLSNVPELAFGQVLSKDLPKQKALQEIAHQMAKINHLNLKKTDGFMEALIANRSDLNGLPFLMGEQCRTRDYQARAFANITDAVNSALRRTKANSSRSSVPTESLDELWSVVAKHIATVQQGDRFPTDSGGAQTTSFNRVNRDEFYSATVAALTQILMPESERFRVGLAKFLATVPHVDATKALAKLAIFSAEEEVRLAAIEGLKLRRERDYRETLLDGFRYPLPAVAKRAAEALVKLDIKDTAEELVKVLEKPDPRLPVAQKIDGKDVNIVRELVRVNHHRNCLLCHAPGNTDDVPEGVLKVAVPLLSEPLPKPSDAGYQSTPPPTVDIVVRLDMTYLRQDFSMLMPVRDAHPWPDMQRFDFLVRTRTLTPQEAQAYEQSRDSTTPARSSPYHRAALFALRELTGLDAEPTPQAWRKVLKRP